MFMMVIKVIIKVHRVRKMSYYDKTRLIYNAKWYQKQTCQFSQLQKTLNSPNYKDRVDTNAQLIISYK